MEKNWFELAKQICNPRICQEENSKALHLMLLRTERERDALRAERDEVEAGFTNLCKHVEKSLPYTGCHSIPEHIDNAAAEIRNLRAAVEQYRKALSSNPLNCDTCNQLKWVESANNERMEEIARLREALEAYKTVLRYRPNQVEWWDGTMEPSKEEEYNRACQAVNNFQVHQQALAKEEK